MNAKYTTAAHDSAVERAREREQYITDEFEKTRLIMLPYYGREDEPNDGRMVSISAAEMHEKIVAKIGQEAYDAAHAAGDRKPLIQAYVRAAISVTMDFLPCVTNRMREDWHRNHALEIIDENVVHVYLTKREPKQLAWRYIHEDFRYGSDMVGVDGLAEIPVELNAVVETVLKLLPHSFFSVCSYSNAVLHAALDMIVADGETSEQAHYILRQFLKKNRFETRDAAANGGDSASDFAKYLTTGAAAIRLVKDKWPMFRQHYASAYPHQRSV